MGARRARRMTARLTSSRRTRRSRAARSAPSKEPFWQARTWTTRPGRIEEKKRREEREDDEEKRGHSVEPLRTATATMAMTRRAHRTVPHPLDCIHKEGNSM